MSEGICSMPGGCTDDIKRIVPVETVAMASTAPNLADGDQDEEYKKLFVCLT